MAQGLTVFGGQLLGMILIISGTVLGLHGSGDGEPLLGAIPGVGEALAGVVLFSVGVAALVLATLRGAAPPRNISNSRRNIPRPAMGKAPVADPLAGGQDASPKQDTAAGLEALIRWAEQAREQSPLSPRLQADAIPAAAEQSSQARK